MTIGSRLGRLRISVKDRTVTGTVQLNRKEVELPLWAEYLLVGCVQPRHQKFPPSRIHTTNAPSACISLVPLYWNWPANSRLRVIFLSGLLLKCCCHELPFLKECIIPLRYHSIEINPSALTATILSFSRYVTRILIPSERGPPGK